jgi:hypothetical protein
VSSAPECVACRPGFMSPDGLKCIRSWCPHDTHRSPDGQSCDDNIQVCLMPDSTLGIRQWSGDWDNGVMSDCTNIPCGPDQTRVGGVCTCPIGQRVDGLECLDNTEINECYVPNADSTERHWDLYMEAWGPCIATGCRDGHHLDWGTCVSSVRECDNIDNGTVFQEWDGRRWGPCNINVTCNPGFTNERWLTNDHVNVCGRCRNAFGVQGADINPTYNPAFPMECVLSGCPYQGQLYNLDTGRNECIPICAVDGATDDTGTMIWNPITSECEVRCAEGFRHW